MCVELERLGEFYNIQPYFFHGSDHWRSMEGGGGSQVSWSEAFFITFIDNFMLFYDTYAGNYKSRANSKCDQSPSFLHDFFYLKACPTSYSILKHFYGYTLNNNDMFKRFLLIKVTIFTHWKTWRKNNFELWTKLNFLKN